MTITARRSVTLVYIYDSFDERARERAFQFSESYTDFPPGEDHSTVIVCQHAPPDWHMRQLFDRLQRVSIYQHDDSGWDIGAFIAVSSVINDDIALYLGSTAHFSRRGWLTRIVESWEKHGIGFYGSKATYEVSPHLNTCGFWTKPLLMTKYPFAVKDRRSRYDFEHGPNAMWKITHRKGMPCKYVTWDRELDWPDWRKPLNGFRRGDQSDCLIRFHHNRFYDAAPPQLKAILHFNTDLLSDIHVGDLLNPRLNRRLRAEYTKIETARFNKIHQFF